MLLFHTGGASRSSSSSDVAAVASVTEGTTAFPTADVALLAPASSSGLRGRCGALCTRRNDPDLDFLLALPTT
jgi:hypothetical protein